MDQDSPIDGRILLIQPYLQDFYSTSLRTLPLGLHYLIASLRRRFPSLQIDMIDALATSRKKTIPLPSAFHYLNRYYPNNDSTLHRLFRHYYHFGFTAEEVAQSIQEPIPLYIGISSLFTPYSSYTLEIARAIKKRYPQLIIVSGGSHATLHPASLLLDRNQGVASIDYILRGQAEESILEFTEFVLGQRPLYQVSNLLGRHNLFLPPVQKNLTTWKWEEIVTPQAPQASYPSFTYQRRKQASMLVGFSCPYQCAFCTVHAVFGKRYRRRDNQDILAQLIAMKQSGIEHINFEDDNFSAHRKQTVALLQEIIRLRLGLNFSAMNGLAYWMLDSNLIDFMKKAGFLSLNLSLVSTDEKLLKELHMGSSDE